MIKTRNTSLSCHTRNKYLHKCKVIYDKLFILIYNIEPMRQRWLIISNLLILFDMVSTLTFCPFLSSSWTLA